MSYLEAEIQQQPEVIEALLKREAATTREISQAIRAFDPAFILIAGRGTSDNAARYAQYAFGARARLPVGLATPSLHTLYEAPPRLTRALVIGISQSGQSVDVSQVVQDAREQGALTLAITNDPASLLARTAQHHLHLGAGQERSVAATKTYTAQLTALALLLTALLDDAASREQLAALPDAVHETIHRWQEQALSQPGWVERYRYMTQFIALGRGYNYATAFEINLKVKELSYITGDAYSEADFRHGPIATVQPGFPVLLVAPEGKTMPVMRDLMAQLRAREAEMLVISNQETMLLEGHRGLRLPAIPEWLSPIVAVIPGQIFAMRLALAKGHDPDKPRGLNKVTVTR